MNLSPARGFVLSRRERGEADLVLELLLEDGSFRRAIAPSGVRSTRRYAGGLSPFTLYRFAFGRAKGAGFVRVDEAVVVRAWPSLLGDLRRTAAAGAITALAREHVEEGAGDEGAFDRLFHAFETLTDADARASGGVLTAFALASLAAAGEPLVSNACVRCGRNAPDEASVTLSARAGGVVCAACGGGPTLVRAGERRALARVRDGDASAFDPRQLDWVADVIEAKGWRAGGVLRKASAYWRDQAR